MSVKKIKCIGIDIDGTLIAENKIRSLSISDKNIREIKRFCEKGGKIVIATGRTLVRTLQITKILLKKGIKKSDIPYLICLNGALVYDFQKDEKVVEFVFNSKISKNAVDFFREYGVSQFVTSIDGIILHTKTFIAFVLF